MTYQNLLRKPFSVRSESNLTPNTRLGGLRLGGLHRSARRRGQALLEMALVVIVLLFLTLGLIQYGLIANTKITMANIAREGARYAAVHGTESTSDDASTTEKSIRHYIVNKIIPSTTLRDITD